jgi:octaprenyl-diphosphate synthase
MARARTYAASAREALESFPGSPAKTALLDVVDFCVDRAY